MIHPTTNRAEMPILSLVAWVAKFEPSSSFAIERSVYLLLSFPGLAFPFCSDIRWDWASIIPSASDVQDMKQRRAHEAQQHS